MSASVKAHFILKKCYWMEEKLQVKNCFSEKEDKKLLCNDILRGLTNSRVTYISGVLAKCNIRWKLIFD